LMRRGLALARSYARKRFAFGAHLSEKPLHVDTLAGLQAEMEAAFHLTFFVAELVGRDEAGEIADEQRELLRFLTPVMKLTTARQAVAVASEVLEAFGGAGYVEDTGLPVLLRDAQVLSIWEGTTNVLSLDALRTLSRNEGAFSVLKSEVTRNLEAVHDAKLADARHTCREAISHAEDWLKSAMKDGQPSSEAGARRFALTVGRAFALARLAQHAQWSLDEEKDARALAATRRFAQGGIDLIKRVELDDARLLMEDK
ncbi:MAG TPA: acyl-CoA dehydrogenase family protein, partial [Pyrinomonadaceae bacterium]|nr:acyl-CoA dehydrogenase family protein [Pyrinomonadaceae bacterium]